MKLIQYFKQAWNLMRQNHFYTAVYILGTALSISLVMVIAIVYHIKTDDIAPEANRSRILTTDGASSKKKDGKGQYNSAMSYQTVRECFYSLETPECVTAFSKPSLLKYSIGDVYISFPGSMDKHASVLGCVDANFWKVFQFSFRQGKPFGTEDFQSGIRKAVLSESLARKLFGSAEAAGKEILLNGVSYSVAGAVRDVSPTMTMCFADLWVPYTSVAGVYENNMAENTMGQLGVCILAKSPADFGAIRAELDRKIEQYNTSLSEYEFVLNDGRPYSPRQVAVQQLDFRSSYRDIMIRYGLVALLFLLVPAVNLSGLIASRMEERITETGIRKAFGASRGVLVNQALAENFFLTLLGGLAGLLISFLLVWAMGNMLLLDRSTATGSARLSAGMMLNFTVFSYAFCVCFVLNLVSSLIPVWNASRKQIVDAINNK
jgi:putative ABC transport system permease protein